MRIPEIERSGNLNGGSTAPFAPNLPTNGATILGQGIGDFGRGVGNYAQSMTQLELFKNAQQEELNRRLEIQKRQDEALEIDKDMNQLRNDWSNRLLEYSENPTENILNTAETEYDKYVSEMTEKASSPRVKEHLGVEAGQYKLQLKDNAYRLQTVTRARNFGASFDTMMANAEDTIYTTRSLTELFANKALMMRTIDSAKESGRIRDPETIQNLQAKVSGLGVAWAQSVMGTSPDQVVMAVRGEAPYEEVLKGVPAHVRATLEHQAEQSLKTLESVDKTAIRQAYESDKAQRIRTGAGSSWNYADHVAAFGKTSADAAQRELELSSRLYDVSQNLRGASNQDIREVIADSKPQDGSANYAQDDEFHSAVMKLAHQALEDKKDDPFKFYGQDPVLAYHMEVFKDNPTPKNRSVVETLMLDAQRADGMEEYELKVMPKDEAAKFINDFNGLLAIGNKTDAKTVQDRLLEFTTTFKDNMPIALKQLHDEKGGEKVSSRIVPLMWHLGNPGVFQATLDALRKDPEDVGKMFKDNKAKIEFLADANTDPNLLKYASSVLGGNNSPESMAMVSGVREAFTAFARDQYLAGGRLKDASAQFFSQYTYGEHNGATFARPMVYQDSRTRETHTVSEQMTKYSNKYLQLYPASIDPKTISPSTLINSFKLFNEKEQIEDIQDALRENVFWSTTEDETGVYLFTKGNLITAPKQVRTKDGKSIRVNFEDTYTPKELKPFGYNPLRPNQSQFKTDSTWFDSIIDYIENNRF